MLVERSHTSVENGVKAWEVIWIRTEPRFDVVLPDRDGTPVVTCLDDFQGRIVGDDRECVEAGIVAGSLDISPETGHKEIFASRWREQDFHALFALPGTNSRPCKLCR